MKSFINALCALVTMITITIRQQTNLLHRQGDYIWIEPQTKKEFDVAIGARVVAAEGRRIQVNDDDTKVSCPVYGYLQLAANVL